MESANSGNEEVLTLSTTLLRLVADEVLTVAEMVKIGGVSDSAISRYQTDEASPNWRTMENLARSHKLPLKVSLELARVLCYGRPVRITADTENIDKNLDFDGDGKVTAMDALAAMQDAQQLLLDETIAVRKAMRDGKCAPDELEQIEALGNNVADAVARGMAVLRQLNPKAREPRLVGGVA